MERTNKFNLQDEVNHFIEKINVNELLSSQEVAELKDHFLSQTEELEDTGLSPQEAFTVSKMRFGKPEMVQEEYEKSKPFEKWKRYLIVGFLSYLLLGTCKHMVTLLIMGLAVLFSNNIILDFSFINYIYILIYLASFIFLFWWGFVLVKSGKIWSYKKFVPWIPFVFILSFSARILIFPYANRILNSSQYSNVMTFTNISSLIVILGIIIITSWGIKKQWLYKSIKV